MGRALGNHEDIGDDFAKFIAALDGDPPSQIWGKSQLVNLGGQVVEPLINIIITEYFCETLIGENIFPVQLHSNSVLRSLEH